MLTEHHPQQPHSSSHHRHHHHRHSSTGSNSGEAAIHSPRFRRQFCSFQDNLASPTQFRKGRRIHGLQLPLHPLQLVGWIALFSFGLGAFLVIIPALKPDLQQPLFGLLTGLYIVHVISHLCALLIDPSDKELRRFRSDRIVPEFDRAKHAHVIENGRCHLCNIKTTSVRTKHCSVCNKCVGKFDHHCKWLNHCIGGRNYVAFLMCVVSAVIAALVILAAAIAELVLYHIDPRWLNLWSEASSVGNEPSLSSSSGIDVNLNSSLVNAVTTNLSTQTTNLLNSSDLLLSLSLNGTNSSLSSSSNASSIVSITNSVGIGLQDTVFLVFVAVLGIVAAITAGLLLHLCFFHVYISFLGLTTYEYIRNHRAQQQNNVPSNVPPPESRDSRQDKRSIFKTINHGRPPTGTFFKEFKLPLRKTSSSSTSKLYFCSSVYKNRKITVRPNTIFCCDDDDETEDTSGEMSSSQSGLTPSSDSTQHDSEYYLCSLLEEKSVEKKTFHCCSKFRKSSEEADEGTSDTQYTEQCTFCSFRIKPESSSVFVEEKQKQQRCCLKTITKHHRWRRKWNCCSNVPDSPDVPNDFINTVSATVPHHHHHHSDSSSSATSSSRHISPNPDTNMLQLSKKPHTQQLQRKDSPSLALENGANKTTTSVTILNSPNGGERGGFNGATNGRLTRPRMVRPWPVSRFRHMLRMIGRYRRPRCRHSTSASNGSNVKQNQVRPLPNTEGSNRLILPTTVIRQEMQQHAQNINGQEQRMTLPALPPPSRRKLRNTTDLQELAETLAFAHRQQQQQMQQQQHSQQAQNPCRRSRRKNLLRNRSPTLSPIHESGLSNPTSPLPCRHHLSASSLSCNPSGSSAVCFGGTISKTASLQRHHSDNLSP